MNERGKNLRNEEDNRNNENEQRQVEVHLIGLLVIGIEYSEVVLVQKEEI